jgi:2-phosphosulfolactate phosphatase
MLPCKAVPGFDRSSALVLPRKSDGMSMKRPGNIYAQASQSKDARAVIDVFRAFTTACHVMDFSPSAYYMTSSGSTVSRLQKENPGAILVGKPDIGEECAYDAPNSPTLVGRLAISGKVVIHRTKSGAHGAVMFSQSGPAIGVCFSNLSASARWLKATGGGVQIIPMGLGMHLPTPEDELCKNELEKALSGQCPTVAGHKEGLRLTTGRCFFEWRQDEYPASDFEHCLRLDRHDFALVISSLGDHALITRG